MDYGATPLPHGVRYKEEFKHEFSVGGFRVDQNVYEADNPCTIHEVIVFDQVLRDSEFLVG